MNQRVLLLDVSYLPIKTITWQKTISLLFNEKIEVIEEFDIDLRSPSATIKMPAVVRLKTYFKRRINSAKFSKAGVISRDNRTCGYCGEKLFGKDITLDHVIPLSQGGDRSSYENIIVACRSDNAKKGARTPEQAGMKLLKKPTYPSPKIFLGDGENFPPEWKDWIYF